MRALLLLALVFVGPQDPAKDLKSKDAQKRIAAVDALGADEKGEKALLGVLKDKKEDWEVLVEAASVLAAHGSNASSDELVKLAIDAPIRALRLAAARTLGKLAPKAGAEALLKKASGDGALRALESLDAILAGTQEACELKGLDKLGEKFKDPAVRAAAARANVRNHRADRAAALERALGSDSIAQQCAVLAVACEDPRADCAGALAGFLAKPKISDLAERRAVRALAAALSITPEQGLEVLRPLALAKEGAVSARAARVVGALESKVPAAARMELLGACLEHKQAPARAAAAHALAALAGAEARTRAGKLFEGDQDASVRLAALETSATLVGEAEAEFGQMLAARLPLEPDANVRERIAVHLGRKGLLVAVDALARALDDPQWGVGVCAAVSLGRTQTGPAVDRLARLLRESKDWKLRGAAAAGLGQSYVTACLLPLADALADPDKSVVATAQAYLVSLTLQPLPPKPEPWKDWISRNQSKLALNDPKSRDAIAQRERERGTFVDTQARERELARIYRDLALFVLEEDPGDHIQKLLARFKIAHVLAQPSKISEVALQPDALFVANCTGMIEEKDVDRLAWFVRAGGHLFGSCWALKETIGRIAPGATAKAETPGEVDDRIVAEPATQNEWIEGVFPGDVQPVYELEGAYLIDVQDPERVQVLVDSPLCAEHWGCGNLAAWFPVGQGFVLDSVNHFESQGLELAEGLKTREDRQAYAVDHMGLSWADLRTSRDEKYWDNSLRASEKIADLSVFRLVTNFVSRWRIEVGR